jgi:hypothetical protein
LSNNSSYVIKVLDNNNRWHDIQDIENAEQIMLVNSSSTSSGTSPTSENINLILYAAGSNSEFINKMQQENKPKTTGTGGTQFYEIDRGSWSVVSIMVLMVTKQRTDKKVLWQSKGSWDNGKSRKILANQFDDPYDSKLQAAHQAGGTLDIDGAGVGTLKGGSGCRIFIHHDLAVNTSLECSLMPDANLGYVILKSRSNHHITCGVGGYGAMIYNTGDITLKKEPTHPIYSKRQSYKKDAFKFLIGQWTTFRQVCRTIESNQSVNLQVYCADKLVYDVTDKGDWEIGMSTQERKDAAENCANKVDKVTAGYPDLTNMKKPLLIPGQIHWIRADCASSKSINLKIKDVVITEIDPLP